MAAIVRNRSQSNKAHQAPFKAAHSPAAKNNNIDLQQQQQQ
jgi:hypothetical protein